MKILLLSLLLSAMPLAAQELPLKPLPTVKVHMTDGVNKWYQTLPVVKKTPDRSWIGNLVISGVLTVADIENSLYALRRSGATEANPIFGSHPSRLRYYAISLPVMGLGTYMSYRYKREDDALAAAGLQGHKYVKWWLPHAMNSGVHLAGVIVTLLETKK